MRQLGLFFFVAALIIAPSARSSPLLDGALQPWLAQRDSWAFTQQVREYDKGEVREERLERYDPSQPDSVRWTLLAINGHAPSPAETNAFSERKNRRHKTQRPLSDYIDFDHVTVQAASPQWVRYSVPLREVSRLVPVDKITLAVTVDRQSRSIEQVTAVLREPLRIAFGVARVTDMNFDLHFDAAGAKAVPVPAAVQPSGTAQATLMKFGNRAEFSWSNFTHVTPYPTTQGQSVVVER